MKRALLCLALVCGTAHAQEAAIAADAVSTAVGLSMPGIVETNPLGWTTIPIRLAVIEHARSLPPERGVPILHAVNASSWGATANNVLVIAGAGPVSLVVGLVVGVILWERGRPEREMLVECARHRELSGNPALVCVIGGAA